MPGLLEFFATHKRLLQSQREISCLKQESAQLREQNASMREGMRRCVSCEYRIDFKNRQGQRDATED